MGKMVPPFPGASSPSRASTVVLARLELAAVEEAHGSGGEEEVAAADPPVQEGLPGPGALDVPAPVAHHRLEDAQPLPGGEHPAGDDAADHRGVHPRLQRPIGWTVEAST
jgi:hypothetical protein